MTPIISENALVDLLVAGFPRSPLQVNRTHESDAELVRLSGTGGPLLAMTVDSIEEEIEAGLYTDPYMIGWVACMASLSDLAATGATPLGILISETLPPGFAGLPLGRLQEGIRDACREAHTFLLGGDTNSGRELHITGCAVGLVSGRPLRRVGISAGDILYSTGPLGAGNAFALVRLLGTRDAAPPFRPVARLEEGKILSGFASACMDSSDGLFTTLRELMRLNGVGISLDAGWESWLETPAAEVAAAHSLPPWCMFAGQHGEYELIFAVPPDLTGRLRELARVTGRPPVRLGTATAGPGLRVDIDGCPCALDLDGILETADLARSDPGACLRGLQAIHDRIVTESPQNHDRVRPPDRDIAV
jgi:thiamine-monophosphate kinase